MLRYMLDTNICIYTIKNRPQEIRAKFNKNSQYLCMSSITLSELIYGAEKSAKPEENLKVVEGFANRLTILPFDDNAAAHAGNIRAGLAVRGEITGSYDILIGAHARSLGQTLVTNNLKEFDRIEGLRTTNWIEQSTIEQS